jgi:Kef-type K+ transport system membrane component KefB
MVQACATCASMAAPRGGRSVAAEGPDRRRLVQLALGALAVLAAGALLRPDDQVIEPTVSLTESATDARGDGISAAASTLMVIRESNTAGPLTDTLTGIIAINNVLALIAFALVGAALDLHRGTLTTGTTGDVLYRSIFPLLWQLAGSVALGFLVGLLLATWAGHVVEHGEMLILLAGCILLTVGTAGVLGLSPLVASLAVGGTMVNLSDRSRRLFAALGRTDPPLYAIFFVIAGADLNLALLPSLGLLGLVYVLGRAAGKVIGTRYAARRLGAEPEVQRYPGPAMLAQAGLAIGLLLSISERFPDLAPTITTVVLAGVAIFELVGPMSARLAFARSGGVGREVEVGDLLTPTML